MKLRKMRAHAGAAIAVAALVAGTLGVLTATVPASRAAADSLSPATGARANSTGAPHAEASGHVYYVDSQNGSDSNTGLSQAHAWKTLAKVDESSFSAGDTIAFDRGDTFTGAAKISDSGTASAPITITAYGHGARPLLTNPGQWNVFEITSSYVSVTGLEFSNTAVFTDDGSGIAGPKYEQSGAIDISGDGAHEVITNDVFSDVGVGVKTYGQYSDIEHNTFENLQIAFVGEDSGSQTSYGAIGISVDNSNEHIAYNDFVNCRSTDSPYGADGGAIEIEGFNYDKDNIQIDHNYSRGSQGFLEVTETESSNVSLSYNVSDDYQQFVAWDTTTTPSDFVADNNTVIRRHNTFDSPLFDIYYYRQAGPTPTASWISIRNNIFDTPYGTVLGPFDWPHDHNLFYGGASGNDPVGYALGEGDLIADPHFTDYDAGRLTLKATSPAVDNGASTTTGTDLLGHRTGVGAGVDMGAFEYQKALPTSSAGLIDGGFEAQSSLSYTTTPWSAGGSLYSGIDVNAGKSRSGQNDAWLASSGTGYFGDVEQTVAVQKNTIYRYSIWVRNSRNIDNGWVGARTVAGDVLGEVRVGTATDYTRYVVTFNSGKNSSVVVFSGYWGPGPSAYEQFDDAVLNGPTA